MSRAGDLQGKVVSEEEVAADLGFANVHDLRRWSTDLGSKVLKLEHELKTAIDERDRFQWIGRHRMMPVFEKLDEILKAMQEGTIPDAPTLAKLRLAIGVVCGKEVDWDHILKDWFPDMIS